MNIQYENQEQSSLLGSYRQQKEQSNYVTANAQDMKFTKLNPDEIVHKVVYGDTLQGLSLTYDVSIMKMKQRNQIQSDQIYHLKTIIIPNPQCLPTLTQEEQQFMKIQEFLCYMMQSEKSSKTARYYLSENSWNVENALTEYKADLQWERTHGILSKPVFNSANDGKNQNLERKKSSFADRIMQNKQKILRQNQELHQKNMTQIQLTQKKQN